MANTRTFHRSFAGGELSPEMFGRIDDVKFQTGAAKVRNFIVTPQGPAENRPGFAYVREVKDSSKKTRLIPFTYSNEQTLVIELGAGYFRFHTMGATVMSGGVPYEIANPYAEADLFDIHYVQSADVMTLVHPKYAPRELRRLGATNWTLVEIDFQAAVNAPGSVTVTAYMPPSTLAGPPAISTDTYQDWSYVVTSIGADGIAESSASAPGTVKCNLYITGAYNTISWPAVSGATRYRVYKLQGGIYGYIGQTTSLSIKDDNIAPDLGTTPPIYDVDFVVNGIQSVPVTNQGSNYGTAYSGGAIAGVNVLSQGSGYVSPSLTVSDPTGSGATFSLSTASDGSGGLKITGVTVTNGGGGYTNPTFFLLDNTPCTGDGVTCTAGPGGSGATFKAIVNPASNVPTLTITDATGSGAVLSPVVAGGKITSINVVNPGKNYTAPTVTINFAAGGSSATFGTPVLTGTNNYPGAVSYYEQRRCFAGSINDPQKIWMTKSGTESQMSYSLPLRDDDRIEFRVAAREANTIRHIVPLTQLIMLTASSEWRVTSVNSDALTPTSISVRPQSYIGANNVQPSIINNSLVYCAARGGHVRELGYSWQSNGFITGDLSLRAAHLFDTFEIKDMAYAKAPTPLLWFVSSTGKLLGLTYVPEQQIGAWHQHDTDGSFESCTVVSEGVEDFLYVVVKRTINGATKRYVERMASRTVDKLEDCFFVDAGGTYSGAPTKTVTGLNWLEGKTVSILADGAVMPQQVVTGGTITLSHSASKIQVGLPYQSDLQTLPVTLNIDGFGQGRFKNINKAWVRVFQSSGIFIGPDENNLTEAKQRTTEPYGSPPSLKSDEIYVMLTPTWAASGQIYLRQHDPLPLTLVGLTLEVAIGG